MLNSGPTPAPAPAPSPVVLAAHDVSFAYGHERVLDGVGLEVGAGEFAALAGPNGSGESTQPSTARSSHAKCGGGRRR